MENTIELIHGDAYKLIKDIEDKSIDMIYTDIPYDISYSGKGITNTENKESASITLNEHKETILNGIDYSILDEFVRVMKKIKICIWCSKSQIFDLMKYFIEGKKCNYNIIVWCKTNCAPFGASPWLSDVEYMLCFYEPGVKFNKGVEFKKKFYISSINRDDAKKYGHPTIKPIEMTINHIKNMCKVGDTVLDPFSGSGTTLAACKSANINAIGFEIDDKFYQIAKNRINGIDKNGQSDLFDTNFEQLELF